jgi:GTP-binding protein
VLDSYVDEEGNGFPFTVQLFSALKRIGIEEADAKILELAGLSGDEAFEEASEEDTGNEESAAPSADDDNPVA